jgi:hypothetical protein
MHNVRSAADGTWANKGSDYASIVTARRGGMHRSLPLLAAFAIVFAPADEGPLGAPQGDRDIASRILAPTVPQALSLARKEAPSQVHIPDWRSVPESLPVPLSSAAAVLLAWASLPRRAALGRSPLVVGRPLVPRAPPALQPA